MTKDFPATLLPEGSDRAFVQDLVYTVIRRLRPLRHVLGTFVKVWPKGEMEALLYIGAAQILYMDEVPDFAAVNETVEAAKQCANPSVARVVNGVLRSLIRRREEVDCLIRSFPVEERESYPSALYRRWVARFGAANAEVLAKWHNEPAETFLAYPDGRYVPLARGQRVSDVAGYDTGAFIVQNPATSLATGFFKKERPLQILDACAAPGGKTIALAWAGHHVTACEVNPRRRARLVENLKRVKLEGAVEVVDSLDALKERLFDGVLVDAPCSNTGVLRRRPDARWNWSEEKLAALVALQAEILEKAAPLVKTGGTLVYSTCSNEPEENEVQVAHFLAQHTDFAQTEMKESLPFEETGKDGWDGAFAAALQRQTHI